MRRLRFAMPALALLAVAALAALVPAPAPRAALPAAAAAATWPPDGITIVAHRCNGADYLEQSVVACTRAAATGARILDVDVRWTRTGVPIALHNADLGVVGAPSVLLANIDTPTALRYVAPELQNLGTIRQIRDVVVASGTQLSIEPKVNPTVAQWDALATALGPIRTQVILSSFDPAVLAEAAAEGYTQLALNSNVALLPSAVPVGVRVVLLKASVIDAWVVDPLNAEGIDVWCFECDTTTQFQVLGSAGVTGFATDDHDAAEVWLAANS